MNVGEGDFPVDGSPRQKLSFALWHAALAPTGKNWQPWDFRLLDTHIELIASKDPALAANDPDGREAFMKCGAALECLKLALKHFGCLGREALFPDLGQPAMVARVHFGFCRERDWQEKLLYEEMILERTSGSLVPKTPAPETMLAILSRATDGERCWLDFMQSEVSRQRAMESLPGDSPWLGLGPSFSPPTGRGKAGPGFSRLLREFAFGGSTADSRSKAGGKGRLPPVPVSILAVVKTKTDEKHAWVAAGKTMARTVLQARAWGLSWAFVNPVRRREAREALRVQVGHKGFAQLLLCADPLFDPLTRGATSELTVPNATSLAFR